MYSQSWIMCLILIFSLTSLATAVDVKKPQAYNLSNELPTLNTVDIVEILTLVDNYIDILLPSTDMANRPLAVKQGTITNNTLLAEHGLAILVTVHSGGENHTVLFDTGYSSVALPHNLKYLGIENQSIEAIVLSHGHNDHTGSLEYLINQFDQPLKVVAHPDAFMAPRYFGLPNGVKILFPELKKEILEKDNVELIESKNPYLLANDTILVSGQIERTTPFEKGMPNALVEKDGQFVQDPILDDQALIVNLGQRGLVIISGCAHAGIINTVRHAMNITGQPHVAAVLGGFLDWPVIRANH